MLVKHDDNGGGQIAAAQALAGALGGAATRGQRFATLSFNHRLADAHLALGSGRSCRGGPSRGSAR